MSIASAPLCLQADAGRVCCCQPPQGSCSASRWQVPGRDCASAHQDQGPQERQRAAGEDRCLPVSQSVSTDTLLLGVDTHSL
jgi:hypothetical protein